MKSVPTNVDESSRWWSRAQFVASRYPLICCTGQCSNDEQTAEPDENALFPTPHVRYRSIVGRTLRCHHVLCCVLSCVSSGRRRERLAEIDTKCCTTVPDLPSTNMCNVAASDCQEHRTRRLRVTPQCIEGSFRSTPLASTLSRFEPFHLLDKLTRTHTVKERRVHSSEVFVEEGSRVAPHDA